ncbi:potassium channel subfamily K member 18-like [Clupea harengus]|uniref:Potassium channel subfamily K member 18-like n=1 Tax=Clupea harengus TaxID=7950 RepID=A0A8M1KIU6_CLUHA|nr:potassium channel subfamily K member 18-like [Clupea harengus]
MSLATNGDPNERSRCYKFFWTLFPHVFLILSLVVYAGLGAAIFWKIEGQRILTEKDQQPYREFVFNLTAQINKSAPPDTLFKDVDKMLRKDLKAIWLQHPENWSFYGSLFFCCTVFTTVGKCHIYTTSFL